MAVMIAGTQFWLWRAVNDDVFAPRNRCMARSRRRNG
jgi:hypothetical protein